MLRKSHSSDNIHFEIVLKGVEIMCEIGVFEPFEVKMIQAAINAEAVLVINSTVIPSQNGSLIINKKRMRSINKKIIIKLVINIIV